MPEDELVVADTSPLLNLSLIGRLDLLESQFSLITVPEQVWDELEAGEEGLSDLRSLKVDGVLSTVPVERDELYLEIVRELDEGETAAIVFAIESDADLVLLDERDGRQVARRHGLDVTGVVGILLRGAEDGTLDLRTEIVALREAGFWLSDDLVEEILRRGVDDGSSTDSDEQ